MKRGRLAVVFVVVATSLLAACSSGHPSNHATRRPVSTAEPVGGTVSGATAGPVFTPVTRRTACRAVQLRATELGAASDGSVILVGVELRNDGSSICVLSDAIVSAALRRPNGSLLPTAFLGTSPGSSVPARRLPPTAVPPGATVSEELVWASWCGSAPGPISVELKILDSGSVAAGPAGIPPGTLVPGASAPETGEPVVPTCENGKASTIETFPWATGTTLARALTGDAGPTCRLGQLTATTSEGQGATGSLVFPVSVANASSASCVLDEPVGVSLIGGHSQSLGVTFTPASTTPDLLGPAPDELPLAPGQAAQVMFQWAEWCAPAPGPLAVAMLLPTGQTVVTAPYQFTELPRCDYTGGWTPSLSRLSITDFGPSP